MRRSTLRLDTDSVVDGRPDSLLAAQVSLGGLDRDVTKEKLDLFQLGAGGMTQPSACSPQVMRGQPVDPGFLGELADNVPNNLFGHAFTPSFPSPIHPAKTVTLHTVDDVLDEAKIQVEQRVLPPNVVNCFRESET